MDDSTRTPGTPPAGGARPSTDPERPSASPAVTGPLGAAAGAAAGATGGTLVAGPVGTIVGALVGAIGGGLAGMATADDLQPNEEDERYYRTHHEGATHGLADAAYDRARPAYHLGHVAALNPDWRGRGYAEVEPELQRAWGDDLRARHGNWSQASPFARAAYERTLQRTNAGPGTAPTDMPAGTTPSHDRPAHADPLSPRADVAGNPAAEGGMRG